VLRHLLTLRQKFVDREPILAHVARPATRHARRAVVDPLCRVEAVEPVVVDRGVALLPMYMYMYMYAVCRAHIA
jgi:hypothetical protein